MILLIGGLIKMHNLPMKMTQEKDNISNLPMNIKNEKFEINKERIKAFSNSLPHPIRLEAVEENGGLFNWFDHNVTGKELNSLITNLQRAFRQNNEVNKDIIKEFRTVYNTFESLDKGYIQGILASTVSASEASQQAESASKQALEAWGKARVAQERIDTTMKALQDAVEKYQEKFGKVEAGIERQDTAIKNLSVFINSEIEEQKLLRDEITVGLESYKTQVAEQSRNVLEVQEKLNSKVVEYATQITEQNRTILDVEERINTQAEEYKTQIGVQNKNIQEFNAKLVTFTEDYKTMLAEQNATIAALNKRIKYAYITAAIAIAIACASLFMK